MNKIINTLSSVRLFFIFSVVLLLAFVIGGVIPQGQSPEQYQEMFGSVGGAWVYKFRLYDVFSSLWFLAIMAGAALNILACTIKQWKLLKMRPGLFLSHFAVILVFMGGVVRGVFSVRGGLAMEVGEIRGEFLNPERKIMPLPFEVQLKDFQIRYWEEEKHVIHAVKGSDVVESADVREGGDADLNLSGINIKVRRFYPNFAMGDHSPSTVGEARENPALEIVFRKEKKPKSHYLFAKYPDFHGVSDNSGVRLIYEYVPGKVKQFESSIAILEKGVLKMEKTINVNSPAYYQGYRFYQSGYDAKNLRFSSIQVSKDPSVSLIYAGFGILMIGLTWVFWRELA